MADIRIKDLTTTASSTASDDFIAVDGTTNGTRKLSAFSPTFGGNATVTGTLTVNGSANGIVANGAGISLNTDYSASVRFFDGATVKWWIYKLSSDENLYFRDMGNARMQLQMLPGATSSTAISTFNSRLEVTSTTASTTTSSGALVVGNGTSGGLGVGGAIVAGGTITSTASTDSGLLQLNLVNSSTGTSASSLFRFNAGTRTATLQAYNDTHATLAGQLRVGTSNGNIVLIPSGVTAATFGASSIALGGLNYANTITGGDGGSGTYILQLNDGGGSLKVNFKGNGDIALSSTTASTSTSSGALVVSGGVGVAGALNLGGVLSGTSSSNDYGWTATSSGVGGPYVTLDATNATTGNRFTGLLLKNNGTLQWVAQLRAGDGNFHIYDAVRSVSTLTIAPGALNGVAGTSTFAGPIAINNTVTTGVAVASTHKVQISIGGTTYYLLASNV